MFLERLRDEGKSGYAKYVVLSNLGEPDDVEKAKKLGADGYIVKATMTPSDVVEKVRSILHEKK